MAEHLPQVDVAVAHTTVAPAELSVVTIGGEVVWRGPADATSTVADILRSLPSPWREARCGLALSERKLRPCELLSDLQVPLGAGLTVLRLPDPVAWAAEMGLQVHSHVSRKMAELAVAGHLSNECIENWMAFTRLVGDDAFRDGVTFAGDTPAVVAVLMEATTPGCTPSVTDFANRWALWADNPVLLKKLLWTRIGSSDKELRRGAVAALGLIPSWHWELTHHEMGDLLRLVLEDPEGQVRTAAATILVRGNEASRDDDDDYWNSCYDHLDDFWLEQEMRRGPEEEEEAVVDTKRHDEPEEPEVGECCCQPDIARLRRRADRARPARRREKGPHGGAERRRGVPEAEAPRRPRGGRHKGGEADLSEPGVREWAPC